MRITFYALVLFAATLSACSRRGEIELGQRATGGHVKLGEHLIYAYGCAPCHVIPEVAEANGRVGPSLQGFGSRYYVAGLLINTPPDLFHWISKPQEN